MKLEIQWVNATRPPEERRKVELIYRNFILGYFNGVENAQRAYENAKRCGNNPFDEWQYSHCRAFALVASDFTPWKRQHAKIKTTFKESEPCGQSLTHSH